MSTSNRWIATGLVALLTMMTLPAMAAPTTWTSATLGYWTNSGSWSAGVPGASDDAIFDGGANGQAIIDGDVTINSLDVNGYTGKIVFTNGSPGDLTIASNLFLGAGATIVCQYVTTNGYGTGRVITVGSNATINGTIDANGQGYTNGTGPSYADNCSGHGGLGGTGASTYGSLTEPTELGSGGYYREEAKGGGAIKLVVAGTLTVDGYISANGLYGGASYGSAAGGSVWLIAGTLTGSGMISANASPVSAGNGRGGGGGRIAIECTNSTFSGSVSAAGGPDATYAQCGQPGTVWAPKNFRWASGTPASPTAVTITNSFQFYPADGTNTTYYWDLTISGGWVEFHSNVLHLSNLVLTNGADLRFDTFRSGINDMQGLTVSNSIVLAANGPAGATATNLLYLPAEGAYNLAGDLFIGTNALLYVFGNTGVVNEAAGGTTNKPYGIGVTITAQTATVNGSIRGRGFPAGTGPTFDARSSGHGGRGGNGSLPYGSLTRPTELGGGGYSDVNKYNKGGGAIKLVVAGTLTVDGTIGPDGEGDGFGGAAGGSVWLIADTLAGGGSINAEGVDSTLGASTRPGGGGRLAVEYTTSIFTGAFSVAGGIRIGTGAGGQTGTLFRCQSPFPLANSDGQGGMSLATALSVSSNATGLLVTRIVDKWQVNPNNQTLSWLDTSTDWASNAIANVATYTLSGAAPNAKVSIYTNSVLSLSTNFTPSGTVTFAAFLAPSCTVLVSGGTAGSVFMVH